jgi:hypothetical protein
MKVTQKCQMSGVKKLGETEQWSIDLRRNARWQEER